MIGSGHSRSVTRSRKLPTKYLWPFLGVGVGSVSSGLPASWSWEVVCLQHAEILLTVLSTIYDSRAPESEKNNTPSVGKNQWVSNGEQTKVYIPGDSMLPFDPLVGGHQQPFKGSLKHHRKVTRRIAR